MYNGRAVKPVSAVVFNEFISDGKLFFRSPKTCNFFNAIFHKQDACYTGITRDAVADSFIPSVCFADL